MINIYAGLGDDIISNNSTNVTIAAKDIKFFSNIGSNITINARKSNDTFTNEGENIGYQYTVGTWNDLSCSTSVK